MITSDMPDRIIRCTNRKVRRIVNGEIDAQPHAKMWPPVWAQKWEPTSSRKGADLEEWCKIAT